MLVYQLSSNELEDQLNVHCLGKYPFVDSTSCVPCTTKVEPSYTPDQRFVSSCAIPIRCKIASGYGHVVVVGDSEGVCSVFGIIEPQGSKEANPFFLGSFTW